MILNEAFRFQNFLNSLLIESRSLMIRSNLCNETTTHMRKIAISSVEDFTEENANRSTEHSADEIINFYIYLEGVKEKLSRAIAEAKAKMDFGYDAELAVNNQRRAALTTLRQPLSLKVTENKSKQRDYTFNVNGDQVSYLYDAITKVEPAFDQAKLRQTVKEMSAKADEVSRQIELANVTTEVDFDAPFDVNDSFEEVFDAALPHLS